MKLRGMGNNVGKHLLLAMRNIDKNVALRPGVELCMSHVVCNFFLVMLNH